MPRSPKKTIQINPLDNLSARRVATQVESKVRVGATKEKPASSNLTVKKTSVRHIQKLEPSQSKNSSKKQLNYQKLIIREEDKMQSTQPLASEILDAEVGESVEHSKSDHYQKKMAEQNVKNWAQWSVAAGFIPLPLVDTAAISGVQIKMIYDLCKIYDVPFKKEAAMTIVSGVLGGGVTTIASQKIGQAIVSKIPYVGNVLSGLTQPAVSYATTYGIGMAFVKHFETNGNLLNFEIAAANKAFKEYYEQAKGFSERQYNCAKEFSSKQIGRVKGIFAKSAKDPDNVVDEAAA